MAKRILPIVVMMLCLTLMSFITPNNNNTTSKNDNVATKDNSQVKVQWMSMEEAMRKNKENPKKVFVDLYTDWCVMCKKMEHMTLNNPIIAHYINENFYPVKFDAEYKNNINFRGKELRFRPEFGKNGVHELAAYLTRGKLSYPCVAFLDESLGSVQPVPGFQNKVTMDKLLHFFGEDFYKKVDWGLFNQLYETPKELKDSFTKKTN